MVLADERRGGGSRDARAVVLLALEDRVLFQTDAERGPTARALATGRGRTDCQADVGQFDGVRRCLATPTRPESRSRADASAAGAFEWAADAAHHTGDGPCAVGRIVGVVGELGCPRAVFDRGTQTDGPH